MVLADHVTPAGPTDQPPPGGERELRLALGMRGGVSLAVWIGGACAEIDELRTSATAGVVPRSRLWGDLARWSGYTSVIVDVMAGASAGGLNGVIYAAAQVYGFDVARLRGAWLELGDLGRMVRTADDDGASLLRGDGYFFEQLRETLERLVGEAGGTAPGGARVDLTLTTTLVEPAPRGAPDALVDGGTDERYATTFRFRHRGPGWPTDLPTGAAARPATAARLALAARATSSFPFAFEGTRLQARRRETFAGAPPSGAGAAVDVAGILGDARSDDRPFVAMDGGVLDNIPLGRALTAIADAPATCPTRRVLLYVRPGGAAVGPVTAVPDADDLCSASGVVGGIIRSRLRPETIRGDVDQLHRHNEAVRRSRRLRRIAFEDAVDRHALAARARQAYGTYQLHRAEHEAQVIRRLLDDPIAVLGEDPFPDTGIDDRRWRAPLTYWPAEAVAAFDGDLADAFGARLRPGGVGCVLGVGVGPISRVLRMLLDWARHLEGEGHPTAGVVKRRLYETLLVHGDLVERPRRLAWVTLAASDGVGSVPDALATIDRLLLVDDDEVAAIGARGDGRPAGLDDLRSRLLGLLDDLAQGRVPEPGPGRRDIRDVLLAEVLVPSAAALARCDVGATGPLSPDDAPGAWIHRAMRGVDDDPLAAADLAALEVVAFAEAMVGAPAAGTIDFVPLSSDNRTAIASAFPRLLAEVDGNPAAPPTAAGSATASGGTAVTIPPDRKLAGNELKNFSAFLRRRWRENDWMWGRLDAVPTLVDLLVTPEALLAAARSVDTVDDLVAQLRALVTTVDVAGDGWPAFLADQAWAPRAAAIGVEAEVAFAVRDQPTAQALDAMAVRATAAASATAGPDGATTRELGVAHLRDAIVASRQWQVFARERWSATEGADPSGASSPAPGPEVAGPPPPTSAPGPLPDQAVAVAAPAPFHEPEAMTPPVSRRPDPALSPTDAEAAARGYDVGTETLTRPRVAADAELVRSLSRAAQRALPHNLAVLRARPAVGQVSAGAVRLVSWAWLDRSAAFWLPVVVGLAATLGLAVGVPPLLGGARSWWAAGAVPGPVLVLAAGLFLLARRRLAAVAALAAGGASTVAACTWGGNALGVAAVAGVVLLVPALAVVALVLLGRAVSPLR